MIQKGHGAVVLRSRNGMYELLAQATDGNVVVYRKGGCPVWTAETYGHPKIGGPEPMQFVFQGDGNICFYKGRHVVFAMNFVHSYPDFKGGTLELTDAGQLVCYSADRSKSSTLPSPGKKYKFGW
eukprot:m.135659 g.135659  ORF g.135659 m.135659 type:complete len:125 (+) comp22613_c0_seq3:1452-1826(+)